MKLIIIMIILEFILLLMKTNPYNDDNPFPKYTMGNDKNLYLNIFNFLDGGINDGKRKWLDYIDYIKDKKIRKKKIRFL